MGTQAIRILVADKQTIFREGLSKLLSKEPDLEVVAVAADGQEALKLAAELKPDILLLDFSMLVHSAKDIMRRLASAARESRVLVLASAEEKDWISEVFRLGARGVVLRESATEVLINALRSVMNDIYWNVDHRAPHLEVVSRKLAEPGTKAAPPKKFGLTPRELEIVWAVVSGLSNRQIAERMSICEGTIKHHLTNIFDKLGVYNRLELALFAIHHGLAKRASRSG
jgi:DNA-binding NarL/FixJ family response regulator